MIHAQSLEDTIIACERKVWDALVAGDARTDNAMLADDFLGVYAAGFAGKADHVGQLRDGPTIQGYDLSDFRSRVLAKDVMLLSYRADFERLAGNSPEAMYVTSIWNLREGAWINIFSQDTVA